MIGHTLLKLLLASAMFCLFGWVIRLDTATLGSGTSSTTIKHFDATGLDVELVCIYNFLVVSVNVQE